MHPYLGGEAIEPAPQHRSTHALSLSHSAYRIIIVYVLHT